MADHAPNIERFWGHGQNIFPVHDPLVPRIDGPNNPAEGLVTRALNLPLVRGSEWLSTNVFGSNSVILPLTAINPDPLGGFGMSRLPDVSAVAVGNVAPRDNCFAYFKLDPAVWQGWDFRSGFDDPDVMLEISFRDPYGVFEAFNVAFFSTTTKEPGQGNPGQNYVVWNHHLPSRFGCAHLLQMAAPTAIQTFATIPPEAVLVGGSYAGPANTLPFVVGSLRIRRVTERAPYRYVMTRGVVVPDPAPVPPLGSAGAISIINGGAPGYEPLSAYCRMVRVQNTGSVDLRIGSLGQVDALNGEILQPGEWQNFEVFRADNIGVAVTPAGSGAGAVECQLFT